MTVFLFVCFCSCVGAGGGGGDQLMEGEFAILADVCDENDDNGDVINDVQFESSLHSSSARFFMSLHNLNMKIIECLWRGSFSHPYYQEARDNEVRGTY